MHLTNQILATKEGFMDFMKNYPSNTPVVMVNLLKFKAKTGNGEQTGIEAYKEYSKHVAPLLAKVGGKVLWGGDVNQTIIGDYSTQPDQVLVVQYPSKEAFISMATSAEYKAISHHREMALEYGGLLATSTLGGK